MERGRYGTSQSCDCAKTPVIGRVPDGSSEELLEPVALLQKDLSEGEFLRRGELCQGGKGSAAVIQAGGRNTTSNGHCETDWDAKQRENDSGMDQPSTGHLQAHGSTRLADQAESRNVSTGEAQQIGRERKTISLPLGSHIYQPRTAVWRNFRSLESPERLERT